MPEYNPNHISDEYVVTWGRHTGKQIREIPASYLLWAMGEAWCRDKYPDFYQYCIENQETLIEEQDDE